ncbi:MULTISPECIES: hypothetical protein [Stenotrophomonas maltophilia group]|uniref:hypothetical protein n=1 Tax=Stenotrophomonas maltophilia group TaxID=995085 RepID=UPI0018D35CAF|nr:hypothetical protein [Stenotrophomonas maltophilia]HDS1299498.1 hypothetical protein [Stenotrophomonas maltophilia]HDS1523524.1 hypothetical protein [Stenotrophomonas maltophilia]HDS1658090.1 hypothetical protein [Stenotrophomonas maltophilia]HDS1671981.1 hypothetical protein [Stenotrophomonas maltophilia]
MNRLIWLALALLPGTALAEAGVVYRCTSSNSDIPTLQRTPCPSGTKQQVLRVPEPASAQPAVVAAPQAPAPVVTRTPAAAPTRPEAVPAAAAAPRRADEGRTIMEAGMVEREGGNQILDSATLRRDADARAEAGNGPPKPPLPPIFQCTDGQGGSYLHEYEASPGRCEPMTVQGLGGVTPMNAAGCEVVRDRCEELPEAQRCGSWQQRFRDARGRERFAAPENRETARGERERLQGVLEASICPVPG